jgi:hypothetical protein
VGWLALGAGGPMCRIVWLPFAPTRAGPSAAGHG